MLSVCVALPATTIEGGGGDIKVGEKNKSKFAMRSIIHVYIYVRIYVCMYTQTCAARISIQKEEMRIVASTVEKEHKAARARPYTTCVCVKGKLAQLSPLHFTQLPSNRLKSHATMAGQQKQKKKRL
jgi:hypothetical protein